MKKDIISFEMFFEPKQTAFDTRSNHFKIPDILIAMEKGRE